MNREDLVTLTFGLLVGLVDNMNDMGILPRFKSTAEFALAALTAYILFMNAKMSPIGSVVLGLVGLMCLLIRPHIVDLPIWQLLIGMALPVLAYHIYETVSKVEPIKPIEKKGLKNIVLPIYAGAGIFSLIEDWLVPEETSCRKLIDKSLQAVALLIGLSKLGETARRNMLTPRLKDALKYPALGWFGAMLAPITINMDYCLRGRPAPKIEANE